MFQLILYILSYLPIEYAFFFKTYFGVLGLYFRSNQLWRQISKPNVAKTPQRRRNGIIIALSQKVRQCENDSGDIADLDRFIIPKSPNNNK